MKHIPGLFDDPLATWKALAIVVTGTFGFIAAVTDSRDKDTHKLTKWGWVAVIGISISTIGGAWAQIVENQRKAQEEAKITADKAAEAAKDTAKTQAILSRLDATATQLRHTVIPLGKTPEIEVSLVGQCTAPSLAPLCKRLDNLTWIPISKMRTLPAFIDGTVHVVISIVSLDETRSDAPLLRSGGIYEIDTWKTSPATRYDVHRANDQIIFTIVGSPTVSGPDGTVSGMYDLSGRRMIVTSSSKLFDALTPNYFSIRSPTGERITLLGNALKKLPPSPTGLHGFAARFPQDLRVD